MLRFSCTKDYAEYSLENTMRLIADKFPDYAILAVKAEMSMNRFARYKNFIDYSDELVDLRKTDFDALQHLEQLIRNLKREIESNADYQGLNFGIDNLNELICIGFSSGCTLINQLMISLHQLTLSLGEATKRKQQNEQNLTNSSLDPTGDDYLSCSMNSSAGLGSSFSAGFAMTNSLSTSFTDNRMFFEILNDEMNKRLKDFYKKLTKLIFLDLGCNAVDEEVYILDEQVLANVVELGIELQVHCTPYQINCAQRPHIKIQEREFGTKLERLNANYKRRLYFEGSGSRSIMDHFKLLKEFEPLWFHLLCDFALPSAHCTLYSVQCTRCVPFTCNQYLKVCIWKFFKH